jgi:hypothetical protein
MIGNLMSSNRNYQIRILMKHSKLNKDQGDLSKEIIDIQDVSVWNKKVRIQRKYKGKAKIGSLNQNLIREDTNVSIDPANKKSIDDVIVSRTQVTDRVDLSEANRRRKSN